MIAYLDCSTGVSGDKFLGALIDAGFDLSLLRDALVALGLPAIAVLAEARTSRGVSGVSLAVTEPGAPRRHWHELHDLVYGATVLPAPVRDGTLRALQALAEAEAHVHGVPVERVHFHEIGAADTLVDTLGVAFGLHALGVTELVVSPVAIGSGTVQTEHGRLPVPAPATALLLQGMPIISGGIESELTTPTGAALLVAHASRFGVVPEMTLRRIGVGLGTRDLGTPNICRLLLGDAPDTPSLEDVVVLESNIDHLTPEELAYAAERLREAGALDVWQTPIVMKKGRAATLLSALAAPAGAPLLAEQMIAETGTLGVRILPGERRCVERDVTEIATSLGAARFKVSQLPGRGRVLRVEADDAARLATEHGLPVAEAAAALEADAARITGAQLMRQRSSTNETKPSD